MKILIILHTGRAGPYVMMDLADTFTEMGHEVVFMRTEELCKVAEEMPTTEGLHELGRSILSLKPDVAMGYGATALFYFRIENGPFVNVFESLRIPYCSIFYDSPLLDIVFTSVALTADAQHHFMFIWDRYYTEELKKLGFKNTYFMPIAANTKRYRKLPENLRADSPFACDVSFVGSWSPKRDLVLRHLADFELAVYGYDWEKSSVGLQDKSRGPAHNISELPFLYNYSKINVNVTMEQGVTSLNMRVFDVIACEGFLISDYKPDFEELFDMDKEIVCYRSVEELPGLVDYYLKNEKERKEKAAAARRRVLREHTYKKRAQYIIDTLKENGIG